MKICFLLRKNMTETGVLMQSDYQKIDLTNGFQIFKRVEWPLKFNFASNVFQPFELTKTSKLSLSMYHSFTDMIEVQDNNWRKGWHPALSSINCMSERWWSVLSSQSYWTLRTSFRVLNSKAVIPRSISLKAALILNRKCLDLWNSCGCFSLKLQPNFLWHFFSVRLKHSNRSKI